MFDPLATNRWFPEYRVAPDGASEASKLIGQIHKGGGLATRLRAAANAVLADSNPTTGDPALAQERDAGIATIKSAHMAPERGAIGEGLVANLSRELAANAVAEINTVKRDDDEALDILKRARRAPRTPDAPIEAQRLAHGAREISREILALAKRWDTGTLSASERARVRREFQHVFG
jgi:hypothetical protein